MVIIITTWRLLCHDLQVFMNELSCFEQQLLFSIKEEYILTETIGSIKHAKNRKYNKFTRWKQNTKNNYTRCLRQSSNPMLMNVKT